MSDTMNSLIFARKWLEKKGYFSPDSDYAGHMGKAAMEVVELIANQGHTGTSGPWLIDILSALYKAYDDPKDPIWQEYWQSDEGKRLIAMFQGASQ